jgi:ABC-type multidrug transport system ATPase subunit
MTVLKTDGLGKRYGSNWGLRDCTFHLAAGRVAALVGPNGAGKTTLLHLAVGLLSPSAGRIWVLAAHPTTTYIRSCPGSGSWPRTTRCTATSRWRKP